MEDRYDTRFTKIKGQPVSLFGVFDGHGGSLAAEYLKEHLLDNLTKHPQFLSDTKLAISTTFLKTDADFLESVSVPYREDGSTALTAVLVGDHLYVANVGDSRAVVSKAGKAIPHSQMTTNLTGEMSERELRMLEALLVGMVLGGLMESS